MPKAIITDQKKEEIRDAADIVDVISDYVKLKKSGSGFTGLCPFHNEKTPSFHVTPRLGIFKCFGCGEGGDVFNFVMKLEGVGFVEALRTLANRYNIEIPEEESPEYDAKTQLTEGIYHALRFAGMFYYQNLMEEDEGQAAREYLKKRGLTAATIKKFGLGFAPDSMDGLLQHAAKESINETYLAEAGLIKHSEHSDKPYDVFRGRLMFPIFNPSGKVIGFGGRIMGDRKGPKYINSPQTKVYNKSEVMYGIHASRNEIRKAESAILVEGYMDVISLWQHGIKNVVATSGTSVTSGQMRLLKNYSENLLMVYDADNAGQNAMIRGLDIALAQGLNVRLMHLPEGEDPDSFVQQFGAESFREYCESESRDFVTFIVERAKELDEWDDPIKQKNNISAILKSMSNISDSVMRETLVNHLRKLSGIGDKALFDELGRYIADNKREQQRDLQRAERRAEREQAGNQDGDNNAPGSLPYSSRRVARPKKSERPPYEKEIIRLMVEYGDDMVFYIGNLITDDHFEDEELKAFYQDVIQRYNEEKEISVEVYSGKEHPFPALIGEIMIERYGISERGNELRSKKIRKDADPYKTARGALKAVWIGYLKRELDSYQEGVRMAKAEEERQNSYREMVDVRKRLLQFERGASGELFPSLEDLLESNKAD